MPFDLRAVLKPVIGTISLSPGNITRRESPQHDNHPRHADRRESFIGPPGRFKYNRHRYFTSNDYRTFASIDVLPGPLVHRLISACCPAIGMKNA